MPGRNAAQCGLACQVLSSSKTFDLAPSGLHPYIQPLGPRTSDLTNPESYTPTPKYWNPGPKPLAAMTPSRSPVLRLREGSAGGPRTMGVYIILPL